MRGRLHSVKKGTDIVRKKITKTWKSRKGNPEHERENPEVGSMEFWKGKKKG